MSEKTERPMRLDAYFYGFESTGEEMVDRILSAVACAGKAFHHTSEWSESFDSKYEPFLRGDTCAEHIQNAANDAAEALRTARALAAESSQRGRGEVGEAFVARLIDAACRVNVAFEDARAGDISESVRTAIESLRDAVFVTCPGCSEAGGAGLPVRHAPPLCDATARPAPSEAPRPMTVAEVALAEIGRIIRDEFDKASKDVEAGASTESLRSFAVGWRNAFGYLLNRIRTLVPASEAP